MPAEKKLSIGPIAADPVLRALELAPPDDEPVTEEEQRAVLKASEQVKRGKVLTHEELLRRLGL